MSTVISLCLTVKRTQLISCALALLSTGFILSAADTSKIQMQKTSWGKTTDGTPVDLYTMTNSHGMKVSIATYGGTVVRLEVPDKAGKSGDVVLGFENLAGYLQTEPYFGALIGRYGNRIGHAQFKLDGKVYKVPANDGVNSLHGGLKGFDKRVWTGSTPAPGTLELNYLSKDGEEGYPGNLSVKVVYTLGEDNSLRLDYSATTDKDTVLNPTNHSYFNLAGAGNGLILNHKIQIFGNRFTPVDSGLIPTGELKSVKGTPFDFTTSHVIGERINGKDEQLVLGKGYDHNFVLDSSDGKLAKAAEVFEPGSGRVLEVWTTQPGVQFYTGNFLDGTLTGKGGKKYAYRSGLCLETQHFPDSPNHPKFPTTELKPGGKFHQTTVWKFATR